MVIFHSYISLPEGSLPDDFRCKERIGPSYEKYAGQRLSHCSSAVKGAMVRFPKRNGEPGGSTRSFPTTWWMKAEDSLKNTISVCSWNFLKASCWVYRMEPYFFNYYKSYEPVNWERDMIRQVAKWIFFMKYSLPFSIQLWFHFIENSCHSNLTNGTHLFARDN